MEHRDMILRQHKSLIQSMKDITETAYQSHLRTCGKDDHEKCIILSPDINNDLYRLYMSQNTEFGMLTDLMIEIYSESVPDRAHIAELRALRLKIGTIGGDTSQLH